MRVGDQRDQFGTNALNKTGWTLDRWGTAKLTQDTRSYVLAKSPEGLFNCMGPLRCGIGMNCQNGGNEMIKPSLMFGILLNLAFVPFDAHALSCLLYSEGGEKKLIQSGDMLKATSRGVTIMIFSMNDDTFNTFQAVLNVPRLSDIRAYGTKDSLSALNGMVVGYLNHSRLDEITVTCKK